uniref:Uncharacterized protein n=1 Tax=Helianthus annuus TaxID=4232 RepID=A0A251SID4_HELAN
MEFDDHLTCSWSAVELINRFVSVRASVISNGWFFEGNLAYNFFISTLHLRVDYLFLVTNASMNFYILLQSHIFVVF